MHVCICIHICAFIYRGRPVIYIDMGDLDATMAPVGPATKVLKKHGIGLGNLDRGISRYLDHPLCVYIYIYTFICM